MTNFIKEDFLPPPKISIKVRKRIYLG